MKSIFRYKLLKKVEYEALNNLILQKDNVIEKATSFIKEIEDGNLDSNQISNISDNSNSLAKSLTSMRDKMKNIREEERKRNWVTHGLAKFVEILRVNGDNLNELSGNILRSLVKYLDANQAALFILNDDNKKDLHLEMIACYAYERKKYLTKRIEFGEGLTGQAFLERATIYMTDVPNDFVKITSGLGEALPRNVLIVPLKVNEEIYGTVEIASFSSIYPYQIEFVEKLGESIASTISNAKTNQQTKKLLIETQQQAEQMKAQEEEMRQNMEELSATQEEVARKQEQSNKLLQKFELVTKTTTEGLWDLEIPKDNAINDETPFFWADRFRQMLGYQDEKDFPNVLHAWSDLLHPDHKQKTLEAFSAHLLDRTGRTPYDVEYQLKLKDGSYKWFRAIGNTVRDEHGNALRVAGSLIDIQGMKDIQVLQLELEEKVAMRTEELKEVLASAQQKNEELRAQEEELRQNMEEMQATQEAMVRKQEEVDKARAENERIRQEEAERALKIGEMQKKTMLSSTLKLKKKVEELQQMKEEMDKVKEAEANRALKIAEIQKQAMNKLVERLKHAEGELRKVKNKTHHLNNSN